MTDPPQPQAQAHQSLELTFEADVRGVTPYMKLATVTRGGAEPRTFASDEPPIVGGLGSAPTPLMYFTAALAF